ERYVREWLEQQAVTGFVDVEDPSAPAGDRRYALPADHVEALVDRDSLSFSAHKAVEIVRAGRRLPDLVEAFRSGGGIPPAPWEPEGRSDSNRARYVNLLGERWLRSIPAVEARLNAEPPGRVAAGRGRAGRGPRRRARHRPRTVCLRMERSVVSPGRDGGSGDRRHRGCAPPGHPARLRHRRRLP